MAAKGCGTIPWAVNSLLKKPSMRCSCAHLFCNAAHISATNHPLLINCLQSNAKFHELACRNRFCSAAERPNIFGVGSGSETNKKKDEMMFQLLERIALLGRRWATFIQVRRELETYSDRELNDMGIGRGDIGRIALEAAALVKPDAGAGARDEDSRPQLLPQRLSPHL